MFKGYKENQNGNHLCSFGGAVADMRLPCPHPPPWTHPPPPHPHCGVDDRKSAETPRNDQAPCGGSSSKHTNTQHTSKQTSKQ